MRKKYKHPWNMQWYESPFVKYLAEYRQRNEKRNKRADGMKLLTVFAALNMLSNGCEKREVEGWE